MTSLLQSTVGIRVLFVAEVHLLPLISSFLVSDFAGEERKANVHKSLLMGQTAIFSSIDLEDIGRTPVNICS